MPAEISKRRNAFRGALLGSAVGEALGLPVDGLTRTRIRRDHLEVRDLLEGRRGLGATGEVTAGLTILTEALLTEGPFHPGDLALGLSRSSDPALLEGHGLRETVRRLAAGEPWQTAPEHVYPRGSFGNGAAARIAPVGLLFHDRDEDLARAAETSALVTHSHPLGVAGAALQARQVAFAVQHAGEEIDPVAAAVAVLSENGANEFRRRLRAVESALDRGTTTERLLERLGANVTALGSVPLALYAFLANLQSFEAAVIFAVNLGGSSGALGAMTGAIAGAFHGPKAIPRRWSEPMDSAVTAKLATLADRLLERWTADRPRRRAAEKSASVAGPRSGR